MFDDLIILKKSFVFGLFPRMLLTVSNCIAHPSNPSPTYEVLTWPTDYCIHYTMYMCLRHINSCEQ